MVLLAFKGKCNESALQNRLKSFWFQGNSFYSLGCCNTGVQLQLLLHPPPTRIITLMVMLPTKYKVDIDDRFQLKMFFPGLDAFPKRTLIIYTGIKYFYVINDYIIKIFYILLIISNILYFTNHLKYFTILLFY